MFKRQFLFLVKMELINRDTSIWRLVVEGIFSMVMFIGLQFFKYKGKKLTYFPFPTYHHLWAQHPLFIMLGILRSWIFNFFSWLRKWKVLNVVYLLRLEFYCHSSLINDHWPAKCILGFKRTTLGEAFPYIKILIEK